MNDVVMQQDVESVLSDANIDFQAFAGKTILITGASGLVGGNLVRTLKGANRRYKLAARIIACGRTVEKLLRVLGPAEDGVEYLAWDIVKPCEIEGRIDYIFHAASDTASASFAARPVEVIQTALSGTENILRLAKGKQAKSVVYVSSMEMYGSFVNDVGCVDETSCGVIDPMRVRSCYPEAKRMCEAMCAAYVKEYGVPIKVARLVQTLGPGATKEDNRICANFARRVIAGEDIVLRTEGKSSRAYCYTADATAALIIMAQKGLSGEAYNVANSASYSSIRKLAEVFVVQQTSRKIQLAFDLSNAEKCGFAPDSYLPISAKKLEALGWRAKVDLPDMVGRLIANLQETNGGY